MTEDGNPSQLVPPNQRQQPKVVSTPRRTPKKTTTTTSTSTTTAKTTTKEPLASILNKTIENALLKEKEDIIEEFKLGRSTTTTLQPPIVIFFNDTSDGDGDSPTNYTIQSSKEELGGERKNVIHISRKKKRRHRKHHITTTKALTSTTSTTDTSTTDTTPTSTTELNDTGDTPTATPTQTTEYPSSAAPTSKNIDSSYTSTVRYILRKMKERQARKRKIIERRQKNRRLRQQTTPMVVFLEGGATTQIPGMPGGLLKASSSPDSFTKNELTTFNGLHKRRKRRKHRARSTPMVVFVKGTAPTPVPYITRYYKEPIPSSGNPSTPIVVYMDDASTPKQQILKALRTRHHAKRPRPTFQATTPVKIYIENAPTFYRPTNHWNLNHKVKRKIRKKAKKHRIHPYRATTPTPILIFVNGSPTPTSQSSPTPTSYSSTDTGSSTMLPSKNSFMDSIRKVLAEEKEEIIKELRGNTTTEKSTTKSSTTTTKKATTTTTTDNYKKEVAPILSILNQTLGQMENFTESLSKIQQRKPEETIVLVKDKKPTTTTTTTTKKPQSVDSILETIRKALGRNVNRNAPELETVVYHGSGDYPERKMQINPNRFSPTVRVRPTTRHRRSHRTTRRHASIHFTLPYDPFSENDMKNREEVPHTQAYADLKKIDVNEDSGLGRHILKTLRNHPTQGQIRRHHTSTLYPTTYRFRPTHHATTHHHITTPRYRKRSTIPHPQRTPHQFIRHRTMRNAPTEDYYYTRPRRHTTKRHFPTRRHTPTHILTRRRHSPTRRRHTLTHLLTRWHTPTHRHTASNRRRPSRHRTTSHPTRHHRTTKVSFFPTRRINFRRTTRHHLTTGRHRTTRKRPTLHLPTNRHFPTRHHTPTKRHSPTRRHSPTTVRKQIEGNFAITGLSFKKDPFIIITHHIFKPRLLLLLLFS